jgi:hypothetical protein
MARTTSVKQILQEIRQLKNRLRLVERQVSRLEGHEEMSPEEEFSRVFPHVKVNPQWFKLVGALPPDPVENDEVELTKALEEAYRS